MKYFELDKSEKTALKAFETGKLKSVPNVKKSKVACQSAVAAMLKKGKNIKYSSFGA